MISSGIIAHVRRPSRHSRASLDIAAFSDNTIEQVQVRVEVEDYEFSGLKN